MGKLWVLEEGKAEHVQGEEEDGEMFSKFRFAFGILN